MNTRQKQREIRGDYRAQGAANNGNHNRVLAHNYNHQRIGNNKCKGKWQKQAHLRPRTVPKKMTVTGRITRHPAPTRRRDSGEMTPAEGQTPVRLPEYLLEQHQEVRGLHHVPTGLRVGVILGLNATNRSAENRVNITRHPVDVEWVTTVCFLTTNMARIIEHS